VSSLQKDVSSQNGGSSDDPFSKDLQTLSDALQSGNLSDAQQIFSNIQDKLAQGQPPSQGDSTSSSTSSATDTMQQDFKTLAIALQSGSTSDAQTAVSALLKDVSSQNGGSSNDPFSKDLQSLSDALQSGSLSDAQNIFASIQDKLASGARHHHEGTAGSAQAEGSSSQDTVAKTLQAMIEALDTSSSSTASTSSSGVASSLKDILTAALQSYTQQSSNSYAQSAAAGSTVSSVA